MKLYVTFLLSIASLYAATTAFDQFPMAPDQDVGVAGSCESGYDYCAWWLMDYGKTTMSFTVLKASLTHVGGYTMEDLRVALWGWNSPSCHSDDIALRYQVIFSCHSSNSITLKTVCPHGCASPTAHCS